MEKKEELAEDIISPRFPSLIVEHRTGAGFLELRLEAFLRPSLPLSYSLFTREQVTGTPKADLPRAMTFVKFMEWEFSERERNNSAARGPRSVCLVFVPVLPV